MIYLVMFLISALLFYFAGKMRGFFAKFTNFIGLSLPIIMATLRNENVGIDIKTYVKPMYLCAKSSTNLLTYFTLLKNQASTTDLEYGFAAIGYFSTKLFNNLNGLFFVFQFITTLMVYLSINKYNKSITKKYKLPKVEVWLSMFCYYTIFYNVSLTMIRQSIACSIALFGILCLFNNEYVKAILFLILSYLFHSTSLFFIVFVLMYISIKKEVKFVKKAFIPVGLLVMLMGGQVYWITMQLINRIIPVSTRYLNYNYMWDQGSGINWSFMYLIGCGFFTIWMIKYRDLKNNKFVTFLSCVVWISIFLIPMSFTAANVSRVLYYCFYFIIILLPMGAWKITKLRYRHKWIIPFVMTLIYWVGVVLLNDYTGTIKYMLM